MAEQFFRNGSERTILDIQRGAGAKWEIVDPESEMTAPSGGGRSVESEWGTDAYGNDEYQGTRFTGQKARFTFDAGVPIRLIDALDNVLLDLNSVRGCACSNVDTVNFRLRQRCGDVQDRTNYEMGFVFLDAARTGKNFANAGRSHAEEGSDMKQKMNINLSAGDLYALKPLTHSDVKGTTNDIAFNKVVWRCGNEWWAATDADSTPGYQSVAAPMVWYTTDNGGTWTSNYIEDFLSGNATDLVISGAYIIACSPTNGVAYARIQDIKDGVSSPWTLATGVTGAQALSVVNGYVFAVGASGAMYLSTDGGLSFSSVTTGTSENLLSVFMVDQNFGWIAGANGYLGRYSNGAVSEIAVSGVSDSINVVAVPPRRSDEVYIGTAGGDIYRSDNAQATTPTFTAKSFTQSGNGQIKDLQFTAFQGSILFIVQSDASSRSRVLRDLSGGNLGQDVEYIGSFTSPGNAGINSIAVREPNFALCVGEVTGSYGYIGQVSAV